MSDKKIETKRYKLSEAVAEIREEHPDIEIEGKGGQVFVIPPPQLWTDEVLAVANDPLRAAQALLGDKYSDFVAAGGSAALLTTILTKEAGIDLGKLQASTAG